MSLAKKAGDQMPRQERKIGVLFVGWALAWLGLWGCSSSPGNTKPVGQLPPDTVVFKTETALCPDRLLSSSPVQFDGEACDINKSEPCNSGCRPAVTLASSKIEGDVDALCGQSGVLCVGKGRGLEEIKELPKRLQDDATIVRVILMGEVWQGPIELGGLTRTITIEGVSNEANAGARIQLPEQADAPEDYAALQIESNADITLKRLHISGGGHGVLIRAARIATLEEVILKGNRLSGLHVESAEEVKILQTQATQNGKPLLREGSTEPVSRLRFGVMLGKVKVVSVANTEIAHNGAGGLARAWETKAVGITHDHRVTGRYEKYGVGITHDHKVAMRSTYVHHNGPIAADTRRSQEDCSTRCPRGTFCEAGICRPSLVEDGQEPTQGQRLLGVGVHIAGAGIVEIEGNSFFGNDTAGVIVHSSATVSLSRNAFERNGVRSAQINAEIAERFAYPAAHLWHVQKDIRAESNVFTDNYGDGLRVGHERVEGQNVGNLKTNLFSNAFWGQGRSRPKGEFPAGTGLRIAHATDGVDAEVRVEKNYFHGNGAAGLGVSGKGSFNVAENKFEKERLRAIAFHDVKSANTAITRNNLSDIRGFGIQLVDISGEFRLSELWINKITRITEESEGDGINISRLSEGRVSIQTTSFQEAGRAGIFLDAARAELSGNSFTAIEKPILLQGDASVTGEATKGDRVRSPLPNRKIALP